MIFCPYSVHDTEDIEDNTRLHVQELEMAIFLGQFKYHPPSFAEFLKHYLEEQNKLHVHYGVLRWLKRNLWEKCKELEQDLKYKRDKLEREEQQRKKIRRVMENARSSAANKSETSDTGEETETEDKE